jgi:hypothetical protein
MKVSEMAGVTGPRTETLKNIFVGVMATVFLVEVLGHWRGLDINGLNLGDPLVFLQVLVFTEVPLWFAQILLWSRGEDIFQKFEPKLIETIQTLERLGFTVQFFEPAIDALKEEAGKMTAADRAALQAAMYALAKTSMSKFREEIHRVDPAKVAKVVEQRMEARELWREGESGKH